MDDHQDDEQVIREFNATWTKKTISPPTRITRAELDRLFGRAAYTSIRYAQLLHFLRRPRRQIAPLN